ncbi:hypothetical protein [Thioclava sp. GXIMD4216]|uniref:hypothetical protein n=1 Tax=Thioclava sp. GXIMD4216 TaxID=3131929 RepID=UPI0030D261CC
MHDLPSQRVVPGAAVFFDEQSNQLRVHQAILQPAEHAGFEVLSPDGRAVVADCQSLVPGDGAPVAGAVDQDVVATATAAFDQAGEQELRLAREIAAQRCVILRGMVHLFPDGVLPCLHAAPKVIFDDP